MDVLKKVHVRASTGASSLFVIQVGGQALKFAFLSSRFSFQTSERHWMFFCFGDAHLAVWAPEVHTLLAAGTAQSRAEHRISPLHRPHITSITLFRAVCGHLGPNWEETPPSNQHPGDDDLITTFLSPRTAPYLRLQSRGCHLALCVRLQGVRYSSDMHRTGPI